MIYRGRSGRYDLVVCTYKRKDIVVSKAAKILGLFSVVINIATMTYIEMELVHHISAIWRMAILASLVILSFSQLIRLRSSFQAKMD